MVAVAQRPGGDSTAVAKAENAIFQVAQDGAVVTILYHIKNGFAFVIGRISFDGLIWACHFSALFFIIVSPAQQVYNRHLLKLFTCQRIHQIMGSQLTKGHIKQ